MSVVCYPPGTDWLCAYTEEEFEALDPANVAIAEALAWMSLMQLTAGQIAFCPVTVRPCRAGCRPPGTWMTAPVLSSGSFAGIRPGVYSMFAPYVSPSGAWVNSCGCTGAECGCSALEVAYLPGPVGEVVEVWLDGAALDPDAYRVDNGNQLVRVDGGSWPACQDLSESAHGDNAFSVTYYRGAAPDNVTLRAAGLLAHEFYLSCTGQECALPANAIAVSRQGISMELQAGIFPEGKTNIPVVDALINVWNPYGLKAAPVIASPDTRRPRMTTVGF